VLALLAAYFCAAALVVAFSSSMRAFLVVPALATGAFWATLHAMHPASQLLVWGEAVSGARVARYEAWQRFPGLARADARMPALPQLGAVRSCDASVPMRFDFDATRSLVTSVEFDARLFQHVSLCYSGDFPIMRAVAVEARGDDLIDVRNVGTLPWPAGLLLADRHAHELPALRPGEMARIATRTGKPDPDAAARAALSRTATDGAAALWKLDLAGVADAPTDSSAWLLVSIPPP